jgi:SAM-dependent methyltransferase
MKAVEAEGPDLHSEGLRWILGGLVTRSVHVAAVLRFADHIDQGATSAAELAHATGADASAVHRVLRLLAASGFFVEDESERFSVTPLGATLRSQGSLRDWALFAGSPEIWGAWDNLLYSVTTGESAFTDRHGQPIYSYLGEHQQLRTLLAGMMTKQSALHNAALLAAYDFSGFRLVVDVGGGNGATLAAILRANPTSRGIVLDLPEVVADTAPLRESGVAERCAVIAGDMLESVPDGGNCYLIKRVLCTLDDDDAVALLSACAAAMAPGGRIVVVDQDLGPRNQPGINKFLDVHFLAVHGGGRMRGKAEFHGLFERAGLKLISVRRTASPNAIFEGTAERSPSRGMTTNGV